MNRPLIMFVVALGMLAGCRSSKEAQDSAKETMSEVRMPEPLGPGVPPGQVRIVGTVVRVDSTFLGADGDPCAVAPCLATVKVEEILGMGSGFTGTIGKGSEISVRFQYTLGETSKVFPEMAPSLPGLRPGSRFKADLRSGAASMKETTPTFLVGRYEIP